MHALTLTLAVALALSVAVAYDMHRRLRVALADRARLHTLVDYWHARCGREVGRYEAASMYAVDGGRER
jgi:hypothetical protein